MPPPNSKGLVPPARRQGPGGKKKDAKKKATADTEAHAQEVREIIRGKDIVDRPHTAKEPPREGRPAAFQRIDMIVVRTWLRHRPLEPPISAMALVAFPRMWTTRRGRYCRFTAPGAGAYGLVRARPSF